MYGWMDEWEDGWMFCVRVNLPLLLDDDDT